VLKEVVKFPKQGFLDGTFDQWLHKATFWFHENPFLIRKILVFEVIEN
jgi:hypothetical protein